MAAAAAALRTVRLEIAKDGIAVIKMIKGENKFNQPLLNDMGEALDEVERNKDVRCLIFTGQGKFFSYGMDLPWIVQQNREANQKCASDVNSFYERVTVFPMPTIAALNGNTFGAGAVFAMCCDYRVMSKGRGWFCFPETKLKFGFNPFLMEIIRPKLGSQSLRDAALFAKRFTAEEALRARIIDEAVDESELMTAANRYGNEVAGDILDRDAVSDTKDKLYGASLRAIREARTVKDEYDWVDRFTKLAQSLAPKM